MKNRLFFVKTICLFLFTTNSLLFGQAGVVTIKDLNILSVQHKIALKASGTRDYSKSVLAFEDKKTQRIISKLSEMPDETTLISSMKSVSQPDSYRDSIGIWLADYSYYLYKINLLEKSITVASCVNRICPENSWAFLVKGDALYELGKIIDAKIAYKIFIQLMTDKGYQNIIPKRILERVD